MLRLRQDALLWPGGRKKCCTLSFDDGTVEDRRIVQMLRERGLKATFNLNSGLFGKSDRLLQPGVDVWHEKIAREDIRSVYEGFELAVHGYTHAHMGVQPTAQTAYELIRCKKELEDIVCTPVRGMAWPIRCEGERIDEAEALAQACGICYARTTRRTYDCTGVPQNFMRWDAACSFVQPELEGVLAKFLQPLEGPYTEPYLLYVWGHGYEATARDAWGTLESFFDRVGGLAEVWYATNIEVYDYVSAVRGLVYSASGDYIFNPGRLDVWLMVDGQALKIPSGKTVEVPAWDPVP